MSRAAHELNVTQGAVSRQIATLQSDLQQQLFVRKGRGISLTEPGQRLFTGVRAGFERIRVTIDEMAGAAGEAIVTITTLPTVASRWLLPQVGTFHEAHRDITLDIRSGSALVDLATPSVDLAIRYGEGRWAGVKSHLLFKEKSFPVCSPGFLSRHGPVDTPADLLNLPLIHKMSRQWWIDWLHGAGVGKVKLSGGVIVDEYELAVQLALDGQGVALGREALIGPELAAGSLQRLFEAGVTSRHAYFVCHAESKQLSQPARLVMDWLIEQSRSREL